jgi:hypothetical protein
MQKIPINGHTLGVFNRVKNRLQAIFEGFPRKAQQRPGRTGEG